jgi:PAS domain S-box-containing protein
MRQRDIAPDPHEVRREAFNVLAESARDCAVVLFDPEGRVSYWSESARRVHGWSEGEAHGAPLDLLYPEGGSEDGTAEEHLQKAMEHGEHAGEGHRLRRDGTALWASMTLTALRDEEGSLLGFAMVGHDLSARRSAEARLKQTAEEAERIRGRAEEANRAKSDFLTVMSHEIRTPLNGMLGYLDLLEAGVGGPITPEQEDHIERARTTGRHALSLVEEILDLNLIEAGQARIERTAGRLGEVVDAAVTLVEPQARRKQLTIDNFVSGGQPEVGYWGDEDRVRQVLGNLLSNAVKFTGAGGRVTIAAEVTDERPPRSDLEGDGPWVRIGVTDTGDGIAPERLEAIFDPFVREETRGRRGRDGFGLGLDISRRLARLMGGDLTVRSALGQGSTFTLWLEAAPAHESGERGEPDEARELPATSFRRAGRVILMELERVLSAFVGRLRLDPSIPSEHVQDEAMLEDHVAAFLADLAQGLIALDPESDVSAVDHLDGSEIQEVVARRHGEQRARLGWSEEEVQREHALLREELQAAVRRRTPPGAGFVGGLQEALERFLDRAERISRESFRAARDRETPPEA